MAFLSRWTGPRTDLEPKSEQQSPRSWTPPEDEGLDLVNGAVARQWQGTLADQHDMRELGRVQQLRRNFTFLSILGFGVSLMATWPLILATLWTSLTDGGTAGLLWGFIGCGIGYFFVYLSVAELASMAPTSAGQYHWVSEFAPRSSAKFLSYIVGWLCFTGWQTAITTEAYLVGTIFQGLLELEVADYVYEKYHGTLLVIAITTFAIIFNTFLAKKLPLVESLLLVLNILGLFAMIFTLWVLAPLDNAYDAWLGFSNTGGWSTVGTSVMVGMLNPVVSMIGFDCLVHMSEEVEDASATVPKAMLYSFGLNWVLGFLAVVTISFTVGDISSLVEVRYPFIRLFYNATRSYAGALVLIIIVIVTLIAALIATVATASRQIWAFSRDKGIPGHSWVAHILPGKHIPLNAVMISLLITSLLSLINIGSEAALNAILTLATVSLLASYMISIGCVLLKRLRGERLPSRRFSLGRWGFMINVISLCYLTPVFIFAFFPVITPVQLEIMNWAAVMFVGIQVIAVICYFLHGRKHYIPPAALIQREVQEARSRTVYPPAENITVDYQQRHRRGSGS